MFSLFKKYKTQSIQIYTHFKLHNKGKKSYEVNYMLVFISQTVEKIMYFAKENVPVILNHQPESKEILLECKLS